MRMPLMFDVPEAARNALARATGVTLPVAE
jgi:hypothetical protein